MTLPPLDSLFLLLLHRRLFLPVRFALRKEEEEEGEEGGITTNLCMHLLPRSSFRAREKGGKH